MGLLFTLGLLLRLRHRKQHRKYITMLRLSLFIFAGLVLYVNATSGPLRDCDGFSASKCTPNKEIVLDGPFPFPTESDCQDACRDVADCEFYSYNGTKVNPECYEFLLNDCDYSGGILVEEARRGSIVDAYHCQDYCDLFESQGCDYWVFESADTAPLGTTCKLYTFNFSPSICTAHHGPSEPHYEDACGV